MIPPVPRFFRAASPLSVLALLASLGTASAQMPRPLFKAAAIGSTPDTLEVFCLYVQFKDETSLNDDPATTGTGTFGSDTSKSYGLDPGANNPVLRKNTAYLEKHFEFAENYFNKASNGQVVIKPRFFPPPDGNGNVPVLTLSKHMKAYNPALQDKSQKQKIADFETEQAQALMTFVTETATDFNKEDSADNPFKVAFSETPSPHRYHAFLLFHAGASRLIDGGTLGPAGANTPNDFLDFFVTQPDFKYLATADSAPGKPSPYRVDSLGFVDSAQDTVSQFMMLSEEASQDGTNWGINGILVNQLARQMGMPDLFDVVRGISQVGYFDVMDFAGYNTQNGFLPVFPSAWTRSFMGWDQPVNAAHGAGPYSQTMLSPADQPGIGRTRTLSIPLNEREYLLVENRQRAARDSTVMIYFSAPSGTNDVTFGQADSVAVPYVYLDSIFADSVGGRKNPYKPSGIITGASHYDVGLPGSGLLVWHVNEWFLESFLKDGLVNAYLGDTLGSQYRGLEVVEADGIPAIGQQFTDALGQPSFDYGTADDVLPHIFRQRKNPPTDTTWAAAPETLSVIGSYGFANTNSWNDGRTGIKLVAPLPANPLFARTLSGFTGDSVFTLRDSALALQVWWPNDSTLLQPAGSVWPVRTEPSGNFQAVNVIHAAGAAAPYIVSASDTGMLQTYAASGKLALAARDTASDPAHYDSVMALLQSGNTRPQNSAAVSSIVDPAGAPLGACVANDTVMAVLTRKSLRLIHPIADSLGDSAARSGGRVVSVSLRGAVGPMAWDNKVFVVDSLGVLRWYPLNYGLSGGLPVDSVALPPQAYQAMAGLNFGAAQVPQVVVVGAKGAAIRVDIAAHQAVDMHPAWNSSNWKDSVSSDEIFSVVASDFDRDSMDDVFLLGSKGAALLFHARSDKQGQAFAGYPQRFPRSVRLLDTAGHGYNTEDRSSPALADLNRDGHPDILFSGSNAVFAVDWHGAWLPGWPFLPQQHQAVGLTYGSGLFPQTVIGSTPLVLSLRQRTAVLSRFARRSRLCRRQRREGPELQLLQLIAAIEHRRADEQPLGLAAERRRPFHRFDAAALYQSHPGETGFLGQSRFDGANRFRQPERVDASGVAGAGRTKLADARRRRRTRVPFRRRDPGRRVAAGRRGGHPGVSSFPEPRPLFKRRAGYGALENRRDGVQRARARFQPRGPSGSGHVLHGPDAGLAAVRTRVRPEPPGSRRVFGAVRGVVPRRQEGFQMAAHRRGAVTSSISKRREDEGRKRKSHRH